MYNKNAPVIEYELVSGNILVLNVNLCPSSDFSEQTYL